MEQKVLNKLEYHKIVKKLIEQCSSHLGKELAGQLYPSYDLEDVKRLQKETSQAKEVLRLFPSFSLGAVYDIRDSLKKAKIGGIIEPAEFLKIFDTLIAAKNVNKFFNEKGNSYKNLTIYAGSIIPLPKLENLIKITITEDGEVSDQASPELAQIRKKLRGMQGKVREKLEGMLRSLEMQKYLQDAIITIRNDRYVIPVKQEYRQYVPGLVHDQSASGASLFIEPMVVVEITNEIQRLEAEEKREVIRILRQLTSQVEVHRAELEITLENLAILDFVFARGRLSSVMDGGEPLLNNWGYVNIIQGRHPLLPGDAVPVTIQLGEDFDTLVITGPNTGGKTVTLKTVGLFTLMALSGLHVPAQTGTELSIFEKIFADIGDEQSIEQSLSTFSSHMTNIIGMLEKVDERSLVLLDELGAGTDPAEGAALAMAVLEYLIESGVKTIATTHYSELKTFAFNRERVENASVEFDTKTLRPTYRLLIGIPGKSNAFEISQRLGLKTEIVDRAKGFMSQEQVRLSNLLANLEMNQLISEKERQEAETFRQEAEEKLFSIETKEAEINRKANEALRKAHEEALEIVNKARRESDAILKEMRELKRRKQEESLQEESKNLRDKLKGQEAELYEKVFKANDGQSVSLSELRPGDYILIKRLNQKAQVLDIYKEKDEVLVQAGIMKMTLNNKEISLVKEKREDVKRERTGAGRIGSQKAKEIKRELDLRGMTVDEAVYETEKYIDDAYLAGITEVYIIHGKGTGALRKAINDLVKEHNFVKSSRIGGYHEGGHGVTMIELRK